MSRSVRFHEFGGPEVLKIEDVVVPDPGPKEVRLRIKAIGLNRSEVLTRSGKAAIKATLPAQLGLEAAGIIDALGSDVDGFAVGDKHLNVVVQRALHQHHAGDDGDGIGLICAVCSLNKIDAGAGIIARIETGYTYDHKNSVI